MSNNNSEQVIVSAKANVMVYDDINRKWNPSGSSPGLSKVQIYQHLLNQTYRVVGRKVQDHEVVINCLLAKGLKYNQANQTFLQWRDSKQVYGLHFLSKEEADVFTQTLKTAVENLGRLAATAVAMPGNNNNTIGNSMAGDNISVGKRSISSDYNPIYDENDRQCYNMVHSSNGNGGISHHNGNGIYNGNNSINGGNNAVNMRQMQQQQQQQSVTSPPLSASSSTSSSSSNGLSIAITNNSSNGNLNGIGGGTNGYHHRQSSDYNYTNGGGSNQIYIKQDQQQQQQQPLYQSSPIPPPPPPPPVPIFANLNGSNPANNTSSNYIASIHSNSSSSNNNDNYSQKIYDVIPDSNFTTGNTMQTNSAPPPPPPPIPNGLFGNSLNGSSTTTTTSAGGPPPPPPPPINQLFNAVSANNSSNATASASASSSNGPSSSYTNEIAKFQQNRLKKVDEGGSTGRAGPQLDFLTEIRQKIEKKQQQLTNGEDSADSATYKPSSLAQRNKGQQNSSSSVSSSSQYGRGGQQQQQQQFDSPKTIKNTPNVVNGNGTSYSNGSDQSTSSSSLNLDKLKQELVNEFRKELQSFKADIVTTILSELRKQN